MQLDDIASQTGNVHGHTAHVVRISSNLVIFSKLADLTCNTDSSCLGHRNALYLQSNHSWALACCPRWLIAEDQAKNKQTGIQDKSIQIKGNPALVIWFQGLTKYLKPRKAKAKAKA
ncbi:hypothetical protein ACYZT9_00240 [Pseudomonas sp. ZT5P21]